MSGVYIQSDQKDSKMEEFHWTETPEQPKGWKEFWHFSYSEHQSPLFAVLVSDVQVFFPPSPFLPVVNCLACCEDLFSLMYFYQADIHWRQQKY